METQRNAIQLLIKIAECLVKECEAWTSNSLALVKAKQDEETAFRKAQEKANKLEEKAAARQQKKEAEKLAKEMKAKQKAADSEAAKEAGHDDDDKEGKNKKVRKQRRTDGEAEITPEDPPVIQNMFKFPASTVIYQTFEVAPFIKQLAEKPNVSAVMRLRRGPFKKVLADALLDKKKHVSWYLVLYGSSII